MRSPALICISLILFTLIVYWPVGNNEFVNFDDNDFITNNVHVTTGINQANVIWAFTPVPGLGWHPITWLSHMIDVEFYGLNPRGHHLTNVFIHITSTLLIFILLFRLTNSPYKSSFVAVLFAIHPMHVESVAWMAERRDVLSTFFLLITLLLYVEYVKKCKIIFYILSILTFIFGLMSKPMIVTLPIIMLFFDFWPLERYIICYNSSDDKKYKSNLSKFISLIKEKIPFFIISFISTIITINIYPINYLTEEINHINLALRIENATTSYLKYIAKMFYPNDMAVYYPFDYYIKFWYVILSFFVLLIISAAVIFARSRYPYLFLGWFWFIITLLPVLGIIQIGTHSIADRYTYIPYIGLFISATWGVQSFFKSFKYQKILLSIFSCIVIFVFSILTLKQLTYWKNSITLYENTLRVTKNNFLIHNNLGVAYAEKGQIDEAVEEFKKALAIDPDYYRAHYNYGLALSFKGHMDEAIAEYRKAIVLLPDFIDAHNNLGLALAEKGYPDEAMEEYKKVLKENPDNLDAHYNLGRTLITKGNLDEAIGEFKRVLEIKPDCVEAQKSLKFALELRKRKN